MTYLLYSMALAALLLLTLPYWLIQGARKHKYRAGLGERLGRVPARVRPPITGGPGSVWVHAVSVGEVLAVSGLVEEMRRRWPQRRVFVSTTTASGQKLARERLGESVFYLPLDFAFAIRPWLRALRPELLVLAETEFWPNLLRLARKSGTRVAAVNARISDRSFPRYRRWRGLLRGVLANVDLFLAQSAEDRRRLLEIGAPAERVQVAGNLKFDVKATPDLVVVETVRELMQKAGATHVIVCGSTVSPEEELCLDMFRGVLAWNPRSMLVLAPRHPERFDQVEAATRRWGVTCWRRSQLRDDSPLAGGVLLLDTIGELGAMYELADVAFVGGSLRPHGGHNILEPARHGVAIVVGPHTENFRDVVQLFARANALHVVEEEAFAREVLGLLRDRAQREELGRRAAEVLRAQAGATARTLTALDELLGVAPVAAAVSAQPVDLSRERS